MSKDSFVLYTKIKETVDALTDDQAGRLFKAILEYETSGTVPELDGLEKIAFIPIKQDLDINDKKWEEVRAARSRGGKHSAEVRSTKGNTLQHTSTQFNSVEESSTQPTVYVNDNVYVNKEKELSKDSSKKKTIRFSPPTVADVQSYCQEKGYSVDADRFVSFYESKGWMIGKNKMKDWRSAVRGWASRDKAERKKQPTKFSNFHERKYDDNTMLSLIEM